MCVWVSVRVAERQQRTQSTKCEQNAKFVVFCVLDDGDKFADGAVST